MNEVTTFQHKTPAQAMQQMGGMNAGTVAVEQERAIAEVQGKIMVAKRFPRDEIMARRQMEDACRVPELAAAAFYSVPRAGGTVTGPSIRLAEELARCWGNLEYGHKELSRVESQGGAPGRSEVEVYCWDMQTNTTARRGMTILHWRDTKAGGFPLRDSKDIDDLIANKASKQLRGRILAIMPKGLLQFAIDECKKTATGGNGAPMSERLPKMVAAFKKLKITQAMLEKHLDHPIGETSEDEMADLLGMFQSIKDGHTKLEEWFPEDEGEAATDKPSMASLTAGNDKPEKPTATPAPAPRQRRAPAQAAPASADAQSGAASAEKPAEQKGTTAKDDAGPAKDEVEQPPVNHTPETPSTGGHAGTAAAADNDDDSPF